jgi:transporter family-2 protein
VNTFYLLLALMTGAGVAVMAVVNARLRVVLGGPFWAAAAQFTVALILVLLVALLTRQPAVATTGLAGAPWWVWTGGAFSATFIVVSMVLTPKLGTALTLASIMVGQLSAALVVDHFGLFGGTVIRLSPLRILGVGLLLLGVVLIRWKSS